VILTQISEAVLKTRCLARVQASRINISIIREVQRVPRSLPCRSLCLICRTNMQRPYRFGGYISSECSRLCPRKISSLVLVRKEDVSVNLHSAGSHTYFVHWNESRTDAMLYGRWNMLVR